LTTRKLILHASGNLPGKVSDNTILAGSGVMHSIPGYCSKAGKEWLNG